MGGQQDQLIAKVLHISAGADPIRCAASKITVPFAALVAYHRHWLGVQQKLGVESHAQHDGPMLAQLFHQQPQGSSPTVESALIKQLFHQRLCQRNCPARVRCITVGPDLLCVAFGKRRTAHNHLNPTAQASLIERFDGNFHVGHRRGEKR